MGRPCRYPHPAEAAPSACPVPRTSPPWPPGCPYGVPGGLPGPGACPGPGKPRCGPCCPYPARPEAASMASRCPAPGVPVGAPGAPRSTPTPLARGRPCPMARPAGVPPPCRAMLPHNVPPGHRPEAAMVRAGGAYSARGVLAVSQHHPARNGPVRAPYGRAVRKSCPAHGGHPGGARQVPPRAMPGRPGPGPLPAPPHTDISVMVRTTGRVGHDGRVTCPDRPEGHPGRITRALSYRPGRLN